MKKTVSFVLFDSYHQKKDIGSSRIRGRYLINHMKEAEEFIQGKEYSAIIFQKTYWKEMMRAFKGIKILDICDPDWLDCVELINLFKNVHAITVPTEALANDIRNMTDTPVHIIPDRLDLDTLPEPRTHKGKAKKVVWFGYSHNLANIEETFVKIRNANLTLKIITDSSFNNNLCKTESVKWDEKTAHDEIKDADFAVFPQQLSKNGRFPYKSNNKTILSWALGLPVATNPNEFERFMKEEERTKESVKRIKEVKDKYDVKLSVSELREVIDSVTQTLH